MLVAAGRDPSAFVGALLPAALTGGAAGDGAHGAGRGVRRRGGRVRRQLRRHIGRRSRSSPAPSGTTRTCSPTGPRSRRLRALAPARPRRRATLVANVGDRGDGGVAARLAGRDLADRRDALVDGPSAAGWHDADRRRDRRRRRPARTVVGRIVATRTPGTTLEIRGLDGQPTARGAPARRAGTTRRTRSAVAGAALPRSGVDAARHRRGLATFAGVGRRLERKGEAAGVVVYDDYGHHPTAIRATIEAVRQREPGRRVWAVYEPLTYHRTAALLTDFADALATADAVADRRHLGRPGPGHDGRLGRGARRRPSPPRGPAIAVAAPGSVDATADWLAGQVAPATPSS